MPVRRARAFRLRSFFYLMMAGIALACVYFGGAGAAFYYRHRHLNEANDKLPPLAFTPPNASTRLLVFAPHCDDETLGCAGLIQQTLAAGGSVRAVIFTNGDGFRTAVERQARRLHIGPADYVQFAALRQQESLRALNSLGVASRNVTFLGYPDRGLMPMWNDHWLRGRPFVSAYTRRDRSPYKITFHPASLYCGADVVADVKSILAAFRPTMVTVTHPAEDHPDHAAAAAFVAEAIREIVRDPARASWGSRTKLRYYMIHRGDWPLPQGMHPDAPLLPPTEMAHADTRWTCLPLEKKQTKQKMMAIGDYPSQTALMGHFLIAFARRDEIYGEIRPTRLNWVTPGAISMTGRPSEWDALSPAIVDPVRDNVLRDLQGGGDIRTVYACRDRTNLFLRIDARQPISARIDYVVHIRRFGPQGETTDADRTIHIRNERAVSTAPAEIAVKTSLRSMEIRIPWIDVGVADDRSQGQALVINVQTEIAGVEVDKTGARFLYF